MSTTIETIGRQAPTALLAVVQHINDHDLGAPLTIHSPTAASPWFTVSVVSTNLPAWEASGLDEIDRSVELRTGTAAGRRWERVEIDARLQPHGIRVHLVALRPLPLVQAVPA